MKTFEHHKDKFATSYVLGNYCWNGCQFFHKDQAQELFDKYNVPEEFKKDIMEAFSDEEIPSVSYDMSLLEKHFYINIGRLSDMLILARDPDVAIRSVIARQGIKEALDILVHDENLAIRMIVATFKVPEHLNILVHDKSEYVRSAVAELEIPHYLQILAEDKSSLVQTAVKRKNERLANLFQLYGKYMEL